MQELTEQQKQLMEALQERGQKVRASTTSKPSARKSPIVASCTLPPTKHGVQPYAIGNIRIYKDIPKPGFIPVQWNRSGLGNTSIPKECLWFSGLDLEVTQWQRGTKHQKAKRMKVYKPLFEYYQTAAQAFASRTEITEERFNDLYEDARPIWLDTSKLRTGYEQTTSSKKNRTFLIRAFALSEAYGSAKDTLIFTVCYIEIYKRWKKDMGWVKARPEAYFMQNMLVYTRENRGIQETSIHFNKTGYIGRPYYKHKRY